MPLSGGSAPISPSLPPPTPWSSPRRALGSHRGWDTELQGMGLSQRVRGKQGWWWGCWGLSSHGTPIFPFEEKENA